MGMRASVFVLAVLGACAGPAPAPAEPAAPEPVPEMAEPVRAAPAAEPAPEPLPKRRGSKWDPPATLGHLETTGPELRAQIDDLIVVMFDPEAGRESLDAKMKLAEIGKPAFPPLLGTMAHVRDTITDDDTLEERILESSLMLADQCLREMDGYLDAHDKAPIRPGTDRKYIEYIVRLHYRRWLDGMGSTPLKDMEEMPGAFDPAWFDER